MILIQQPQRLRLPPATHHLFMTPKLQSSSSSSSKLSEGAKPIAEAYDADEKCRK